MSPASDLPTPHRVPYRIGLVCLGNICRSAMADTVLASLVDGAGLGDRVEVTSCGTGGWHVGEAMDPRAAATLLAAEYDPSGHQARQLDETWADRDVLLAMDADNLDGARAALPGATVLLFRDFDPVGPGEVLDPWYGGPDGFTDVLDIVERTGSAIVAQLEQLLPTSG